MTTFPVVVVALTSVMAFTSLGLFDPLVLPHLQRALGAWGVVVPGLGASRKQHATGGGHNITLS